MKRAPHLSKRAQKINATGGVDRTRNGILDAQSLNCSEALHARSTEAAGAIFFEQETSAQTEESLQAAWLSCLSRAMLSLTIVVCDNEHDRRS